MQATLVLRERLQAITVSAESVIVLFLIFWTVFSLMLTLSAKRKKKKALAEVRANPNHFTLRVLEGESGLIIFGGLFWAVLWLFVYLSEPNVGGEMLLAGVSISVVFLFRILQNVFVTLVKEIKRSVSNDFFQKN